MSARDRPHETLPPGVPTRLDPVCNHFESAWLAGQCPRLEDFLAQVEEADRPALLGELLALDMEYRARAGERPTPQDYHLRLPDQKQASVLALKALNFHVVAAGDSYNDTNMLKAADAGIFFRPPANIAKEFPQFPVTLTYAELRTAFCKAANLPA